MSFSLSSGASGTSGAPSPVRVIIVDDSAVIRGLISRALKEDSAIEVVGTAGNGDMAIDVLKRIPADVVILDIEMPVMDGLTAIPRLKAIDPAVQIVMASTLTQKNAEVSMKAMALGATDYIPKPSSRE
ncbi:MAG: response regulator, partial [Alphaproteobacteria bacterium]|nr:response regulator [Alphaproteobacteria bacterium]